jgi:plastocyanin
LETAKMLAASSTSRASRKSWQFQTPKSEFFGGLVKEIATMSRLYRNLPVIVVVGGIALAAGAASAEGWGSLKGRFTYDGTAPVPTKLNIDKDQAVCGTHDLVDQSIEVGSTGGLANVAVWVRSKVKVNPDFEKTANDKVTLDNHNCHFEPHAIGLRVGQTLTIKNSDPVAHNTKVDGQNLQVNPLIPAGSSVDQSIDAPETLLVPVSCSIHGWMHAVLVVRPNPYFAISDKDGNFEIKDLPAGEWEFQVIHERSGFVTDATVGGQEVKWPKGHVKWTIEDGKTTDLGEMKLGAAQFNK